MSQINLDGIYAATLTPFFADESVDAKGVQALVENAKNQQLNGVYVGGSTGEAFMMSLEERQQVLELTAEANQHDLQLIAHVGTIRTDDCCTLAKAAKQFGYDAVSAVTPFYYPLSFDALLDHYKRIVDAADGVPMVVYNFPAMSGVSLTADQISQLLSIDNVVALKQTSGDLYQMEQIASNHPDKVIFNGFDEIFLPGQLSGARGGIGSTYNIMGKRYAAIREAIANNDIDLAKTHQAKANRVIDTLVKVGVFSGLKYILKAQGIIECERVRRPLQALTSDQETLLNKLLEDNMI
ncbi:N-acetylneuraminate lyase [Vibrio sp. MACH09]|uniref:N-acetylneuraminate lyase n=1 Tax=unclassified Vibrio TaxID=2614977 RepID=UPI001493957D|nr:MULTISPECIES: N-acetylneuraminate lyase [unclassified Vibrio]NOI64982.1 N-acetylneuraminate lyase [Vibrio sp. 99-8-1]GLO62612.1 N-acetylneuraminate lyase [Vibrio sp. MACH09]